MKYLTEKEAWLKIAEWFKQERVTAYDSLLIKTDAEYCSGLCKAVSVLYRANLIDYFLWQIMTRKIKLVKVWTCSGYYWPENAEGDKERVKFCLERAAEL